MRLRPPHIMVTARSYCPLILVIAGILMASFFLGTAVGQENPCSFSGCLWGTDARASFEVYADAEVLTLFFTWPEGTADFRVRAMDRDKKEVLIDQSLSMGDLLTLKGRGIYYFEIYSAWGGGCWTATVKGDKETKNR